MKQLYQMTLQELEQENNPKLLIEYRNELNLLGSTKIAREVIEEYFGLPLEEIARRIEEKEYMYYSEYYFPGESIIMYPNIKEHRTKQILTCDFSAAIIYPGSLYVSYRPMIKVLGNNTAYVLSRTLKVEEGYFSDLPTNIQELEVLTFRMKSNQEMENGIDFSHLSQRVGEEFGFQKLKRRRK